MLDSSQITIPAGIATLNALPSTKKVLSINECAKILKTFGFL